MSKEDMAKYFDDVDDDENDVESVCEEKIDNDTPAMSSDDKKENAASKAALKGMPKREFLAPAHLYKKSYKDDFLAKNPTIDKETKFQDIKLMKEHEAFVNEVIAAWKTLEDKYKEKYDAWKKENLAAAEAHELKKTQQNRRPRKRAASKSITKIVEKTGDYDVLPQEIIKLLTENLRATERFQDTTNVMYAKCEQLLQGYVDSVKRHRQDKTADA